MPSIAPRPLLNLIVPLDLQQPDTSSEASDTTTCSSTPRKRPESPQFISRSAPVCQDLGEMDDNSSLSSTNPAHEDSTSADIDVTETKVVAPLPSAMKCKGGGENKTKTKKFVGFDPLSTLYVFHDDTSGKGGEDYYDVERTWYSSRDLKAFRGDAFLTVKWMVMKGKGIDSSHHIQQPPKAPRRTDSRFSNSSSNSSKHDEKFCYYSNKYGYDRQKEIRNLALKSNYEFCERGIESKTPMGRSLKNRRRMEALRVVMLYQQMQKQHRRETKREQRRQKQKQHLSDEDCGSCKDKSTPGLMICRHAQNPEAFRKIEAEIDANALANVYGSYCKDTAAEALDRGRADAVEARMRIPTLPSITTGMPSLPSSSSLLTHPYDMSRTGATKTNPISASPPTEQEDHIKQKDAFCYEEDLDEDFMDNLVNLSFIAREDDEEAKDECSITSSISSTSSSGSEYSVNIEYSRRICSREHREDNCNESVCSDTSVSLADLISDHEAETSHNNSDEEQNLDDSVEVEFVEGNNDRIHCSESGKNLSFSTNSFSRPSLTRRKSLLHPQWKSLTACSSLPMEKSILESPRANASFSSLELGNIVLNSMRNIEWWNEE